MDTFFLGSANPRWLADLDVPLCLAYHHLADRRVLPRARAPWLLDSGAYSRLGKHGSWDTLSPRAYIAGVRHLAEEVGNLAFAGPMDWLVGDDQLRRTGLPVQAHLWNTVTNYVDLVDLWGGDPADCLIIPSLQGRTETDFHACWDLYDRCGVDLSALPRVGLGSIASRQAKPEVARIVESLHDRAPVVLHGYGVKGSGLRRYGHLLSTTDSFAWSFGARRGRLRHPDCTARHATCSSCPIYALAWRRQLLSTVGPPCSPQARPAGGEAGQSQPAPGRLLRLGDAGESLRTAPRLAGASR